MTYQFLTTREFEMKASFVSKVEKLPIPSRIIEELNLKNGDLVEVQVTKLHAEKSVKKEILSLLSD